MSGTSLDGLDLAYCKIWLHKKVWRFKIQSAKTRRYTAAWREKLATAHQLSASDLFSLDHKYGQYLAESVLSFLHEKEIKKIDFIASHGHTIYHQPENGFTYQLGNGQVLHDASEIPVVYDFRSLDVVRGGQGAPLVPIGDRLLFGDYDVCLNLGGIGNLSTEQNDKRIAFDFCFANMGLNYLAAKAGHEYDKNGVMALAGKVDQRMLQQLQVAYSPLRKKRPSLGREGFEKLIQPILDNETISLPDRMRTFCESIADETRDAYPRKKKGKLLITGGGALHSFLIQLIQHKLKGQADVVIPEKQIVEFKEALVFALLGVLRVRGEVNCLKSVTGARKDSSGGIMIGF